MSADETEVLLFLWNWRSERNIKLSASCVKMLRIPKINVTVIIIAINPS